MKELSIEEKARRYDEAIKVAKRNYETIVQMDKDCTFAKEGIVNTFHHMFPELKESEDERIRKSLIDMLKNDEKCYLEEIAWLEKQGEQKSADTDNKFIRMRETKPKDISEFLDRLTTVEQEFLWEHIEKVKKVDREEQKPTDKIEPKFNFKVNQWIVATGKCVYLIAKIDGFNVTLVDTNGDEYMFDTSSLNDAHEWTIQDAKDGDVLAAHECLVLFKEIDGLNIKCYCTYHYLGSNPSFYVDTLQNKNAFYPATKKQREFLFKKMHDAGYEWDSEKKELKKIEQKQEWRKAKKVVQWLKIYFKK